MTRGLFIVIRLPERGHDRPGSGRADRRAMARRRPRCPQGPGRAPYVRGEFNDPKSEGSGRSVPLAERVVDALSERPAHCLLSRQRAGLLSPQSGRPLDRSKLIRRFKQATAQAEVPPITFHESRHTFGTRMAAAGVPLRTIQHWMGHADAKTTEMYAHYQPSGIEASMIDVAFRWFGSHS